MEDTQAAGSADAQAPQEISSETTPAQETTTQDTTAVSQATPTAGSQAATPTEETWEYNGDRKAVPSQFEKYVKGLDRYVSKKDQALADTRRKAEEYDKFVSSDQYKSFQQFLSKEVNPSAGSESTASDPLVTQDELDAIALGDAKTLQKVISREVKRNLEADLAPKEQAIQKQLQSLVMKQRTVENAEMIQQFAQLHPDFWDLYENGMEDFVVENIKGGKSLEDTYKAAKTIEAKLSERLETQRKANNEKKKAGTVAGKSIPGVPDTIYADNEAQAKRLAIELTLKGDNRQVLVKKKK